jgi:hypothetical protein
MVRVIFVENQSGWNISFIGFDGICADNIRAMAGFFDDWQHSLFSRDMRLVFWRHGYVMDMLHSSCRVVVYDTNSSHSGRRYQLSAAVPGHLR